MNDYEQPQKRQRTKKKDITLMTLLAFESTGEARKLLKKHNKPDAKNHYDLEQKLAQLYVNTNDKAELEKELAEIHPHKNWLFKTLPNLQVSSPNTQESGGTAVTKIDDIKREVVSSFEGSQMKEKCSCCACAANGQYSNFEGGESTKLQSDYMNLIALVAVIGLTFYIIKK